MSTSKIPSQNLYLSQHQMNQVTDAYKFNVQLPTTLSLALFYLFDDDLQLINLICTIQYSSRSE